MSASNCSSRTSGKSESSESTLSPNLFNNRLKYASRYKNSTVKSKYLRNHHEYDLSSQLGYSNSDQFFESDRNSRWISTNDERTNSRNKSTPELQSDNQTNNGANLYRHSRNVRSNVRSNSGTNSNCLTTPELQSDNQADGCGTFYRHSRNVRSNCRTNSNQCSTQVMDENNNDLNSDEEVPMCFSYIQDCAIYGVPCKERKRTYRKLFEWYIFSSTYDFEWFVKKEWRKLLVFVILLVIFELIHPYYRYKKM